MLKLYTTPHIPNPDVVEFYLHETGRGHLVDRIGVIEVQRHRVGFRLVSQPGGLDHHWVPQSVGRLASPVDRHHLPPGYRNPSIL